jgi:hypothetical protein
LLLTTTIKYLENNTVKLVFALKYPFPQPPSLTPFPFK